MCFIRQRSVQCDAKVHWEVAMCYVHTVPADVELFATFTIPQAEEADLRLCRVWITVSTSHIHMEQVD